MAAEVGGRPFDHNLIDTDTDSEPDIYSDNITNKFELEFASRSSSPLGGQLPLGNIENISHQPSFDTITVALSNFHIRTISKENIQDQETGKSRARRGRPPLDKSTFDAPALATRSEDRGICDNPMELPQAAAGTQAHTQEGIPNQP